MWKHNVKMEYSCIKYLNSIQSDRTIAEPLLLDGVKGFTHRIRIYKHYAYENPNYR